MSRRRKSFPCGHKGYGQICHRCLQEDVVKLEKQEKKRTWQESFAFDPIDLKDLPSHVVLKARSIINGLQDRRNYREFGGKRLRHNRQVVSIPVTRNYRMLCLELDGTLQPQQVMSHEDYNTCKPGG
jgi:hypothetical protein